MKHIKNIDFTYNDFCSTIAENKKLTDKEVKTSSQSRRKNEW